MENLSDVKPMYPAFCQLLLVLFQIKEVPLKRAGEKAEGWAKACYTPATCVNTRDPPGALTDQNNLEWLL